MTDRSRAKASIEKGLTLIETMIYIALLSGIMSTYLPYAVSIQQQSLLLIDRINSL